jgi:maltokinase
LTEPKKALPASIDEAALEKLLAEHLPAQRWFGARAFTGIERITVLREGTPGLLQVLVHGDDGDRYQAIIGLRLTTDVQTFYEGKAAAMIGELDLGDDLVLAYDAAIDPELSIGLLGTVMPDTEVTKARPLGAEQSNTSLVFDERLVLKIFRRLPDGPNPDAEVTRALARIGFEHVIPPLAEWRDERDDYGIVMELLVGAADGWHLAMTSLRDLYDSRCAPEDARADFGFEAERLGKVTAQLHVAMAEAFGVHEADVDSWLRDMEAQLARVDLPARDARRARDVYEALREVEVGPAIRIHGDFHLGQALSSELGWFVLDFEGEPARPLEERRRPSSPMRDVAGLVRSLHYAAQVALRDVGGTEDEVLADLADAWERHNAERFLAGYEGYAEVDRVLPPRAARQVVRRAFELDKAVYEVAYEVGHRPDWVSIPMSAVNRLLEDGPTGRGREAR